MRRDIYLRGCWMLFIGFWVCAAAGLWAWATWLDSIVIVFWFGDDESCTFVSIGLFTGIPITSMGSDLAALSEFGVLCWTILIPPALTWNAKESNKKKKKFCDKQFLAIFDELEFVFAKNWGNSKFIHLPAGARPATFCFDSSSDILSSVWFGLLGENLKITLSWFLLGIFKLRCLCKFRQNLLKK